MGSWAIFLKKFLHKSLANFTRYIQNFKLNSEKKILELYHQINASMSGSDEVYFPFLLSLLLLHF